jgi:hypothetical protein
LAVSGVGPIVFVAALNSSALPKASVEAFFSAFLLSILASVCSEDLEPALSPFSLITVLSY